MYHVLNNNDLLRVITNLNDTGRDYKATISVCWQWYNALKSHEKTQTYMHVFSTWLMSHVELIYKNCNVITLDLALVYAGNLMWALFSRNPRLTIKWLEDNNLIKYVNWFEFNTHTTDLDNFIEKYPSYVYWNHISLNNNMTSELAKKYSAQIGLKNLINVDSIDAEFIDKNWSFWNNKYCHPNVPLDKVMAHGTMYQKSLHPRLSLEYIRENYNDVDWAMICQRNRNLTDAFIIEYARYIRWDLIINNPCVSQKLIDTYDSELKNYSLRICDNPNITIDFIKRHFKQIYISDILQRRDLTFEMLDEHIELIKVF